MRTTGLTPYKIRRLSDAQLEELADQDNVSDKILHEVELELDRRAYDASDPWSPVNTGGCRHLHSV